ncbi:MAG: site-2 protease family protein [Ignavibacteriaceae bacterium]|jgi:membrane-associated protease RseP (regulator of RpoE activity)|nr:site-2 protease family protein [Ignavibacteriaceae bacterium]MCU0365533.1 site-2 protease family protein [Ignavibacteriaceae bacterium]
MPDPYGENYYSTFSAPPVQKNKPKVLLHIGLFFITFITTTIAGVQWISASGGPYELSELLAGLPYSISIILIITFHEFGHYFAAVFHKVKATLPFYIPFPPIPYMINFGTMGAVIRTRSRIHSKKAMFDIGVAGPISGFVVTLVILIYGFLNVPGIEYLLNIHPDYFEPTYGKEGYALMFGDSLLFSFLKELFVKSDQFFPPMSEIYHYPFLCVGWFGLFITSMNMIPVGQLDGGHISFAMFGEKTHYKISVVAFSVMFIFGIIGLADSFLELNYGIGWSGWFFWALILYFIIKLDHPPVLEATQLDSRRMLVGYFSFFIFLISFSPMPIMLTLPQ